MHPDDFYLTFASGFRLYYWTEIKLSEGKRCIAVNDLSDQVLLRAYCDGDREAFDALYRRYASRIYATAYRLTGSWEDAEDTLQDVFIQLVKKASTIRREGALSAWLYRAAVNRTMDLLRRRRHNVSLDDTQPQLAQVVAMESIRREARQQLNEWREEMLAEIAKLVPRLPERQSAVFVLHGFQGLGHEEIASILGCSEASSRSNYSLACSRLREWMVEKEESEIPRTEKRGER